jgi:uncharacterized membrane protein
VLFLYFLNYITLYFSDFNAKFGTNNLIGKVKPVVGDLFDSFNQVLIAYFSYECPSTVKTGSSI